MTDARIADGDVTVTLDDAAAALREAVPDVDLKIDEPGTIETRVNAAGLESAAHALSALGTRLADLFAVEEAGRIMLRLVYALDRAGRYLVVTSPAPENGEYAALSEIAPAAFTEECEIYEQFGIRPAGGKPLNRVVMPPHAEARFPLRADQRPVEPADVRAPHYVRGEAFEFPFGPVRVVGWESLYMGLVTTGEEVLDLYLFHWHKHRGAERRLVGLHPDRALFLVERTEGLSAVGNGLAFCRAVETATGLDPPAPATCTRAVALELERIYNHATALAMMCQTTGLSVGQAQAEIALETLLRLNLAAFGHRYLFGVLTVGGVRRRPDRDAINALLGPACDELGRVIDALLATNSHLDRLEATGTVTPEAARRLALVGPAARASACAIDCRNDHPHPPYDQLDLRVATRFEGDVLARTRVFIDEITESRRLIEALIDDAGDGVAQPAPNAGSALGWAESPRGEALAWVDLDGSGNVRRVRLRPAAVRNWRAFDDAARSQNVFTDIPIIEASFWLTVAGFAR
jgi:Ni,Fe-hydrogenase III large subunit/Ni,Fe-hydrogenase III component G